MTYYSKNTFPAKAGYVGSLENHSLPTVRNLLEGFTRLSMLYLWLRFITAM